MLLKTIKKERKNISKEQCRKLTDSAPKEIALLKKSNGALPLDFFNKAFHISKKT